MLANGRGPSKLRVSLARKGGQAMENNTDTTEYEAPRIEDHGDLTELTAAGSMGSYADGTIYAGESIEGHLQSSP
jgi:hypothetical protein